MMTERTRSMRKLAFKKGRELGLEAGAYPVTASAVTVLGHCHGILRPHHRIVRLVPIWCS
jgi:hypothetical protein